MSPEDVNQHAGFIGDSAQIVRPAPVVYELTQRYPRVIRGVRDALSVALVVRYSSVHTPLALAAYTTSFLVYAEGSYWVDRWRERGYVEQVPEWEPYNWLRDVCWRAKVPMPLVRADRPTPKGHEFDLIITEWVEREGRPMTVDAWLAFKPLLRDVAGMGCNGVFGEPDPDHGGITTLEFQGVRLQEYVPPPKPDPIPECSIDGCTTTAVRHALLDINGESQALLCGVHLAKYTGHVIDSHPALASCEGERWWYELEDGSASGCTDVAPELPELDESDRECTPDPDPLLPQVILPAESREGSGAGMAWPAPTGPPGRAPVIRPPGATEGTRGGHMFDLLACAQGPLRRGTLAAAGPLSPTTADKLLTAWADLGVCRKVGSLWQVTSDYSTSASLIPRGREDDAGE